MVHAGTRRGHPCLVAVSPDGGHLCAGHSAVMKILTSVDALCAAFVSIPDELPFSLALQSCFLVPFHTALLTLSQWWLPRLFLSPLESFSE